MASTSKCSTTNKKQYDRMVELLSARRDIAQGFSRAGKEEVNAFWLQLAEEVNSYGPPQKDATAWRKVWLDYKSYIKRKLSHNKNYAKLPSGSCKINTFNETEETAIRITELEKIVYGVDNMKSFGAVREDTPPVTNENHSDLETTDITMTSMDSSICLQEAAYQANRPNQHRPSEKGETLPLLQKQVNLQEQHFRNIDKFIKVQEEHNKEMSINLEKIHKSIQSLHNVELQKLNETQRHNKQMEELILKKIEIKLKILELEILKSE